MNEEIEIAKFEPISSRIMVCVTRDRIFELEEKATAYDTKEVQDLIECDRIERKLIELNKLVSIKTGYVAEIVHTVVVGDHETEIHVECNKNKLEALTNALEWVEGEK